MKNKEVQKNEAQKKFETRAYSFDLRAERRSEENIGVIVGRPIVYESKTDLGYFDEIIARGALDKADLRDVLFFVNHDLSKIPVARSRNNNKNSTMQLIVDNDGMGIRANLDLNNTESNNLFSAVERGDITGMSFMFIIESEEWDDLNKEHPTRTIKAISRVIEVSAVNFPAYEDTEINTRNKSVLESARALENVRNGALENARKNELELIKAKNRILGGF